LLKCQSALLTTEFHKIFVSILVHSVVNFQYATQFTQFLATTLPGPARWAPFATHPLLPASLSGEGVGSPKWVGRMLRGLPG